VTAGGDARRSARLAVLLRAVRWAAVALESMRCAARPEAYARWPTFDQPAGEPSGALGAGHRHAAPVSGARGKDAGACEAREGLASARGPRVCQRGEQAQSPLMCQLCQIRELRLW